MPDERSPYDTLPIPTYEEATSATPYSTTSGFDQPRRGYDGGAEQASLLDGPGAASRETRSRHDGRGNYRAPTVESEDRSSYDSDFTSPDMSSVEDDEALRHDIEEMDFIDIGPERRAPQRTRLRLPKTLSHLRQTLSSINLPFLSAGCASFSTLASRLPSVPCRFKIPWPIVARLIGLFIIISGVYGLMVFRILGSGQQFLGPRYDPASVRKFVQSKINKNLIQQNLKAITFDDHIAGTNGDFFTASRIQQHFLEAGLDEVFQDNYRVYLNYPKKHGRKVAIVDPPNLRWKAKLEEGIPQENAHRHQSAVFHGLSKSGNVTGPLIYANYGSRKDFEDLKSKGIDLKGSIVLVRFYGSQPDPALKVKAAELAGAVGCIIYSDARDDGMLKGIIYPDGEWRPSDSVRRGSVALKGTILGDVLTPGEPSTVGTRRIPKENNPALPNIPSLPLAWRDARVLLKSLKGHGFQIPGRQLDPGATSMEWWSGNSSTSPIVNLKNILDESDSQPIRNIIGKIQGYETQEKTVYIGNHRDAWCFGATDPGSGTAVLMEVVRVFGILRERGWRPRRSIVFASWDAAEYNFIGSTEHVEERLDKIRMDGVAYLNVASAVSGKQFWADASPVFQRPLQETLKAVEDPVSNKTLFDKWEGNKSELGVLGVDSDYAAFQDLAGCSSIDFGFKGQKHDFPDHSCYDSFDYMMLIGDRDYLYFRAVAQVWALLLLKLADEPIIPFNITNYAVEIRRYVKAVKVQASKMSNPAAKDDDADKAAAVSRLNMQPLEQAADLLFENARKFSEWENTWLASLGPGMGESAVKMVERVHYNDRIIEMESNLLDLPSSDEDREGGLPGRPQFKHVIYGPQSWSEYKESFFPAIREAIDAGEWQSAQELLEIAAKVLERAAQRLFEGPRAPSM